MCLCGEFLSLNFLHNGQLILFTDNPKNSIKAAFSIIIKSYWYANILNTFSYVMKLIRAQSKIAALRFFIKYSINSKLVFWMISNFIYIRSLALLFYISLLFS